MGDYVPSEKEDEVSSASILKFGNVGSLHLYALLVSDSSLSTTNTDSTPMLSA